MNQIIIQLKRELDESKVTKITILISIKFQIIEFAISNSEIK